MELSSSQIVKKKAWRLLPDEVRCVRELTTGGCTQQQIAALMGMSVIAVRRIISGRTYTIPDDPPLTACQQEVLEGTLLGDGHLRIYSAKGGLPSLEINRAASDSLYLEWQAKVFGELACAVRQYTRSESSAQPGYKVTAFRTKTSEILAPFYRRWYKEKRKVVPPDLTLTPLMVAVWLADDGCIFPHWSKGKYLWRTQFATLGFQYAEVQYLAQQLRERLGVPCFIKTATGKNQYYIVLAYRATLQLAELLDPVWPLGIERKAKWRHPGLAPFTTKPERRIVLASLPV